MVVIVIYIAYVKVVYGVNKSLLTGSSPTGFMLWKYCIDSNEIKFELFCGGDKLQQK